MFAMQANKSIIPQVVIIMYNYKGTAVPYIKKDTWTHSLASRATLPDCGTTFFITWKFFYNYKFFPSRPFPPTCSRLFPHFLFPIKVFSRFPPFPFPFRKGWQPKLWILGLGSFSLFYTSPPFFKYFLLVSSLIPRNSKKTATKQLMLIR
jgi:hypothetical protein